MLAVGLTQGPLSEDDLGERQHLHRHALSDS